MPSADLLFLRREPGDDEEFVFSDRSALVTRYFAGSPCSRSGTGPNDELAARGLNSPLTKSCSSDSVAVLSFGANQRWRWDDRAAFRMT